LSSLEQLELSISFWDWAPMNLHHNCYHQNLSSNICTFNLLLSLLGFLLMSLVFFTFFSLRSAWLRQVQC